MQFNDGNLANTVSALSKYYKAIDELKNGRRDGCSDADNGSLATNRRWS